MRLIIGRRLERLDENEKRALAAAAVIGRSFSFRLLTAVSQMDVDELFGVIEKAQGMGIVVPSSEGPERPFTFSHELVRQTLLAGTSALRRERLHTAVADAIERLNPDAVKERAGEIADHLLKAGSFADSRRVVSYLTLAGKSALGAAAFDEARRSFRTAVSHLDAADLRQRADLLASLAMAERGLDHWDMALAHLREVVEIYVNLGDPEKVGGSFAKLTGALISVGRFKEAIETAHRGLACLQADISAGRVRLLAGLAQALAGTGAYGPADEAMQEGLNIASRLSDPKLEARLLSVRSAINFLYFRLKEAAADALRSQQLGASEVSPWQRAIDLRILQQILVCLGSMEEALRIADELEPLARKIGQSYEVALCVSVRAWAEFAKAPDLAKLKIGLEQVPKSDQLSWFAYWETLSEVQLSLVDFFRGNWATALLHAQASCQLEVERVESSTRGLGVGTLFRQMAYAGDRAGAFGILEGNLALLPVIGHQNIRGSWWMLALVIEGLVALGEQSKAAPFYPLARELIGTGAVALWPVFRFTQTIAGIAAVAARQWEAAEEHFQIALQQAESLPNVFEQAEIRRFRAMMLIDRAAPGDRETARTLLKEALETYTQIGMPRHLEMTQALLTRAAGR